VSAHAELDLLALARQVGEQVPAAQRAGFVVGRTAIRDAVAAHLACSQLEAETIVDTLVGRGLFAYVVPPGDPAAPGIWQLVEPR